MRRLTAAFACLLAFCVTAQARAQPDWHLIPGTFEPNRGPDGNSIFLDAPDGLILVDTGRHPAHRDRLLAYAAERGRTIVAIFNTHWHLDHSTGAELRAASRSCSTPPRDRRRLAGFRDSRTQMKPLPLTIPPEREAEVRTFSVMDHSDSLRPTRPVLQSADMVIGRRPLRVNVAPHAATEADLWIHDAAAGLVIAGDLVVAEVPFMDTACPEGWRRALDTLAATRFTTLIPGHGAPMDHAVFLAWRTAFNNLLDCAASDRDRAQCIAGWRRDAARFIGAGRRHDR
jgi:glyoxylase-like metal-dependent hydrolase (beta-lactamase superfamily II)